MIYGAPLADILLEEWESTFTALGYVGLIILVLEGRQREEDWSLYSCPLS